MYHREPPPETAQKRIVAKTSERRATAEGRKNLTALRLGRHELKIMPTPQPPQHSHPRYNTKPTIPHSCIPFINIRKNGALIRACARESAHTCAKNICHGKFASDSNTLSRARGVCAVCDLRLVKNGRPKEARPPREPRVSPQLFAHEHEHANHSHRVHRVLAHARAHAGMRIVLKKY